MSKEEETIRIYTGPSMIAKGLIARLNELGISPVERNDSESAIIGGFHQGVPDQLQLFIRKDEMVKAQETITQYLTEIGEK